MRAATSGFFLVLATVTLLNAHTSPLDWRIAAEMIAMAAGAYNASLALPAYAVTGTVFWAQG